MANILKWKGNNDPKGQYNQPLDLDAWLQGHLAAPSIGGRIVGGTSWFDQYRGLPVDIGSHPRNDYSFKEGIDYSKFENPELAKKMLAPYLERTQKNASNAHQAYNKAMNVQRQRYPGQNLSNPGPRNAYFDELDRLTTESQPFFQSASKDAVKVATLKATPKAQFAGSAATGLSAGAKSLVDQALKTKGRDLKNLGEQPWWTAETDKAVRQEAFDAIEKITGSAQEMSNYVLAEGLQNLGDLPWWSNSGDKTEAWKLIQEGQKAATGTAPATPSEIQKVEPTTTTDTKATTGNIDMSDEKTKDAVNMGYTEWSKKYGTDYEGWKDLRGKTLEAGEQIEEREYNAILKQYVDFLNTDAEDRATKFPEIMSEIQKLTDKDMGDFFETVKDDLLKKEQLLIDRVKEDFEATKKKIDADKGMDLREKNDAMTDLLNDYKLAVDELDVQEEAKDAAYFDAITSSKNSITNSLTKAGINEAQAERKTDEFIATNLRSQGYTEDKYDKYIEKVGEDAGKRGVFFGGEKIKMMNEVNEERAKELLDLREKAKSSTADLEDYKKLLAVDKTAAVQGLAAQLGSAGAEAFLKQQGVQYNPADLQGFTGSLTAKREESEKLLELARKGLEQSKASGETSIERKLDKATIATDYRAESADTAQARDTQDIQTQYNESLRDTTEEERLTEARVKQSATENVFQKKFAPFTTRTELYKGFAPTQFT